MRNALAHAPKGQHTVVAAAIRQAFLQPDHKAASETWRHVADQLREASSSPQKWLQGASRHEGSWWPDWTAWLSARSGEKGAPPAVGSANHPPLEDAPGSYVLEK